MENKTDKIEKYFAKMEKSLEWECKDEVEKLERQASLNTNKNLFFQFQEWDFIIRLKKILRRKRMERIEKEYLAYKLKWEIFKVGDKVTIFKLGEKVFDTEVLEVKGVRGSLEERQMEARMPEASYYDYFREKITYLVKNEEGVLVSYLKNELKRTTEKKVQILLY